MHHPDNHPMHHHNNRRRQPKHNGTGNITTGIFTIKPQTHANRAMMRIAGKWWWAAALPLLVSMFMSFSDWRWIVVTFALLLVVLPPIMIFTWFSLLTRHDAIRDIYPHTATFGGDSSVLLTFHPMPTPASDSEDNTTAGTEPQSLDSETAENDDDNIHDTESPENATTTAGTAERDSRHPEPLLIPKEDIELCEVDKRHMTIKTSGNDILIPVKAFASLRELATAARRINDIPNPEDE